MFPSPQSVLPLPSRPNLERYRKIAKDLVKICKSAHATLAEPTHGPGLGLAQADALRAWTSQWVQTVAELSGVAITPELPVRIRDWVDGVEDFARRKLLGGELNGRRCALADAQFVLARCHGFESWPRFSRHLESTALEGSSEARFEAAVDAIVRGDAAELRRLLREQPGLIRERSTREHRATLLHYVSANGVEGYRQKTPPNIVEIAEILLQSGAEVDAAADVYGGGATTLGLTATSGHPERAGVQEDLMSLLLEHGAMVDGSLMRSCLANGRVKAAEFLSDRGVRLSVVEAAALGRLQQVRSCFTADGSLTEIATREEVQSGFLYACQFGRNSVVEFLVGVGVDPSVHDDRGQTGLHWAAIGGHLEIVDLLLWHGAPLDATNAYGGTVIGQAIWSAAHDRDPDRYVRILEALFAAGAKLPERHAPVSDRIDAWLEERGSHVEPAWKW